MPETTLRLPVDIELREKEWWWGGRTADGVHGPFSAGARHRVDLHSDLGWNQGAPLLVSSGGRYLWSDRPFSYEFDGSSLRLAGSTDPVVLGEGHQTLKGAYRAASASHFPPSKATPTIEFLSKPQYNTWIELNHRQTQSGVLEFAAGVLGSGFPPGVLMIDAGWADYFGHLDFHPGRFPDPAAMVRRLKELGFRVMLWVSPFVSADSPEFRRWRGLPGWLLREADGRPAILEWWDGHSAHLDVTHPEATHWFLAQLERLRSDYGVDGFKFDGGDTAHYLRRPRSWLNASPVEITEAWARLGLRHDFHELRASWRLGGLPVVQRLHDRAPTWDRRGLASLIPNAFNLGLLGHPYITPDLVGGGDYLYFIDPGRRVDEELFVRWTQASALFPMIQFSCAPWRVLSPEGLGLCRAAIRLRESLLPLILGEAQASSLTGEPLLRPLEYEFPGAGYATIADQFMLGERLMAAPVLQPGARSRRVLLPPGRWRDDRGVLTAGPAELEVDAPIERLPHWMRG